MLSTGSIVMLAVLLLVLIHSVVTELQGRIAIPNALGKFSTILRPVLNNKITLIESVLGNIPAHNSP